MGSDNLLLIVAVIAVIVSLIGAGMTYSYLNAFRTKMTGFAAAEGWINLTVEENVAINFTVSDIDWESGMVDDGETNALLDTSNQTADNVTRGNWTGQTDGLHIENIGNRNVSLDLTADSDNATMIGGTAGGGPLLDWKISSGETDPRGSCSGGDFTYYNNTWKPVNTSQQSICGQFEYTPAFNELEIDIFARVPSDSITGARTNTITATFAAA